MRDERHYDRFAACLEDAMLSLGIQRDLVVETSQIIGTDACLCQKEYYFRSSGTRGVSTVVTN
jgi:hypothetical protein